MDLLSNTMMGFGQEYVSLIVLKKIAYESTDLFIRLYWSVGDMYLLQVRKHEYYRVLTFRRMDV